MGQQGPVVPERQDTPERPWETCSYCNYDRHICKGCGDGVPHKDGLVCHRCRDLCKHEIMLATCAVCTKVPDANPHDGLLIEQFNFNAKYKGRCQCCPEHQIAKGDLISRAVEDSESGRPPFKDFGWVCGECSDAIAYPQHKP